MLYSFDVFDTIITRKVGEPRGIFVIMQNVLMHDEKYRNIDSSLRENFAVIRERAIELASKEYKRRGIEEVTIDQIYEAVALSGNISYEDTRLLLELERHTEIDNVVGINDNITRIKELLENNERVVLISDMYLDEETVRIMLAKADPVLVKLPLYLSSTIGMVKGFRKYQSGIYRYVGEKEKVRPGDWIHTGDDYYADFWSAIWAGEQVDFYEAHKQSPVLRAVLDKNKYDIEAQYAVGASCNTCTNLHFGMPGRVGCSFSGYILYSYVQWILNESLSKGIKRLYFIARDGFILRKIAQIIIAEYGLDIQAEYIYGSRMAWRMASYGGSADELREIITLSSLKEVFTVEQYAKILRMNSEELCEWFPEFNKIEEVSILTFYKMTDIVCANEEFRKYLVDRNKEANILLTDYLRQEINVEDDSFAFVDMNGSGNSQICISHIMKKYYSGPIQTFFYKMDRMYHEKNVIFHCFSSGSAELDMILEPMTRNLEEQTVGYKADGSGNVVPVTSGREAKELKEYGYEEYAEGIIEFAKTYSDYAHQFGLKSPRWLADLYLKEIMLWPESEDFLFFANIPFNNSGRDKKTKLFAPKLEKHDIDELFLYKGEENPAHFYSGVNLEMSLCRRSPEEIRLSEEYYFMDQITRSEHMKKIGINGMELPFPAGERIPYELLGKKIVLYGAGAYGKKIYSELQNEEKELVAWIDSNAKNSTGDLPQITEDLGVLKATEYDTIIISILIVYWARQVRERLLEFGVDENKIYCPALEV